jgi:hypothetical protein
MQAVRIYRTGGPEVLVYEQIDQPAARPGEVVVKIEACGVNFKDIYQRNGSSPVPLPCTLGREAAGVVAALGPGVTGLHLGERLVGARKVVDGVHERLEPPFFAGWSYRPGPWRSSGDRRARMPRVTPPPPTPRRRPAPASAPVRPPMRRLAPPRSEPHGPLRGCASG